MRCPGSPMSITTSKTPSTRRFPLMLPSQAPSPAPTSRRCSWPTWTATERDEALVFAKTSGTKPLKVYIFDDVSGSFSLATVIEGDGTAFDAVEYVSVDGNPGLEVILGRQLSDQILQSLSVYAYGEGRMAELMNTSYTEFKVVDLNSDDRQDVLVLRQDPEGRTAVAEYYNRSERPHGENRHGISCQGN